MVVKRKHTIFCTVTFKHVFNFEDELFLHYVLPSVDTKRCKTNLHLSTCIHAVLGVRASVWKDKGYRVIVLRK